MLLSTRSKKQESTAVSDRSTIAAFLLFVLALAFWAGTSDLSDVTLEEQASSSEVTP